MKHHCGSVQRQLTLTFDQDASHPLPENLRRVLSQCPHCRDHHEKLMRSQAALQTAAEQFVKLPAGSLWPALQERLPVSRPVRSHWTTLKQNIIPAFSTMAACLAIAVVLLDQPRGNSRVFRTVQTRDKQPAYLQLMPASQQASLSTAQQQVHLPNWSVQSDLVNPSHGTMLTEPAPFDEQSRLIEQEFRRRQQELLDEFLQRHPALFSH